MNAHTPGPWKVILTPLHVYVATDNGATVQAGIATMDNASVQLHRRDQEANARLIAAAPDLLVEAIELLKKATYQDGYAQVFTQDCEALEAAIRKATEGQP